MSYRTYVNGVQVFGNNEYYAKWLLFIKSQGIKVDEEERYEGEITDFMGAMEAIEAVVMDIDKDLREQMASIPASVPADSRIRKGMRSLFDLSGIYENVTAPPKPGCDYRPRLFDELYDKVSDGYLFMPIVFYDACKDLLQLDPSHPNRFRAYKLKPGKTIHVQAG